MVGLDESSALDGFANPYGKATAEEDFNSVVEVLFTSEAGTLEAARRYPALSRKLDLAMEFYECVDPECRNMWSTDMRVE